MARQNINYGANPNDGTGDTLRVAMDKINDNFTELFNNSSSQNIAIVDAGITNNIINGNISLDVSGTGTVQTTQGLLVNTNHENSNSIFYSADGNDLLTIDVQNKRIGVNKSAPLATFDLVGTANISGNVAMSGSVVLGTSSSNTITVNGELLGDLIPINSHDLGSSSKKWENIFATNIAADELAVANIAATRVSATEFTGDVVGNLITSNDITIKSGSLQARINSEPLTAPRQINFPDSSGTIVTKNNGRMSGPFGTAPTTLVGNSGDVQGDIAVDNNYVYVCTADYDGTTSIWKRSALTATGIAETLTSISFSDNTISYTDEAGNTTDLDLSTYLDDTNLPQIVSATLDSETGIATFIRNDSSTFTADFGALLDNTNLAYLVDGDLDGETGIATFIRDDSSAFTMDFSALLDNTNLATITVGMFDTDTGELSLIRDDSTSVTIDLDGRYLAELPAQLDADLQGSVFADDSTLLVDGVNGKIVGPYDNGVVSINPTNVTTYDIFVEQDANTHDLYVSNKIYGGATGSITNVAIASTPPANSTGADGDKAGMIALDANSIYYCIANWASPGTANIWVKQDWSTTGAW